MVGSRSALNVLQVIPEIDLKGNFVVQPHVWYTCPAGRKAIVEGVCLMSNFGAATEVDLDIGGTNALRWRTVGSDPDAVARGLFLLLGLNVWASFKGELTAGQTLETNQNAGSNANVTLIGTAKETRA